MCFTHIVGQGCVVTLSASQRLRRLLQNLVVLFGKQSKQAAQGERHRERKQSERGDNKINNANSAREAKYTAIIQSTPSRKESTVNTRVVAFIPLDWRQKGFMQERKKIK